MSWTPSCDCGLGLQQTLLVEDEIKISCRNDDAIASYKVEILLTPNTTCYCAGCPDRIARTGSRGGDDCDRSVSVLLQVRPARAVQFRNSGGPALEEDWVGVGQTEAATAIIGL